MLFRSGIVGIISTITMIFIGLRKAPKEITQLDANAAKSYADAAESSARRAEQACRELDEYKEKTEGELKLLHDEIAIIKQEREELKLLVDDLQDWAERLVHQVKSLGGDPVKIRKRK